MADTRAQWPGAGALAALTAVVARPAAAEIAIRRVTDGVAPVTAIFTLIVSRQRFEG